MCGARLPAGDGGADPGQAVQHPGGQAVRHQPGRHRTSRIFIDETTLLDWRRRNMYVIDVPKSGYAILGPSGAAVLPALREDLSHRVPAGRAVRGGAALQQPPAGGLQCLQQRLGRPAGPARGLQHLTSPTLQVATSKTDDMISHHCVQPGDDAGAAAGAGDSLLPRPSHHLPHHLHQAARHQPGHHEVVPGAGHPACHQPGWDRDEQRSHKRRGGEG